MRTASLGKSPRFGLKGGRLENRTFSWNSFSDGPRPLSAQQKHHFHSWGGGNKASLLLNLTEFYLKSFLALQPEQQPRPVSLRLSVRPGAGSDASAAAEALPGYCCSQVKRKSQLPWYPAAPFSPRSLKTSKSPSELNGEKENQKVFKLGSKRAVRSSSSAVRDMNNSPRL